MSGFLTCGGTGVLACGRINLDFRHRRGRLCHPQSKKKPGVGPGWGKRIFTASDPACQPRVEGVVVVVVARIMGLVYAGDLGSG